MGNNSSFFNLIELYEHFVKGSLVMKSNTEFGTLYTEQEGIWPNVFVVKNVEMMTTSNFFLDKKQHYPLLLTQSHLNEEVAEFLVANNYRPVGNWVNMEAQLDTSNFHLPLNKEDVIQIDVENTSLIKEWCDLVSLVLFSGHGVNNQLFFYGLKSGFIELLALKRNNRIVCSAMLFKGTDAGIYMVATHPEYRKQGLAKKMVNKAHEIALQNSYCKIVLQSTTSGLPLYKSLLYQHQSGLFFFKQY